MSNYTELIERLLDVPCYDKEDAKVVAAAADAIEALQRESAELRKDAEAFRAMVDWDISLAMFMAGRFISSRRAGSRQAWSATIHGDDVRGAARKAVEMAIPRLGGNDG